MRLMWFMVVAAAFGVVRADASVRMRFVRPLFVPAGVAMVSQNDCRLVPASRSGFDRRYKAGRTFAVTHSFERLHTNGVRTLTFQFAGNDIAAASCRGGEASFRRDLGVVFE